MGKLLTKSRDHGRLGSLSAANWVCLLLIGLQCGCVKKARTDSETRSDALQPVPPVPPAQPVPSVSSVSSVPPHNESSYSMKDRQALLSLARQSLRQAATDGKLMAVPSGLPEHFKVNKGCFVTLTVKGSLRGCIGNITPEMPLAEAVIRNARSAALFDSRFSPVTADELSSIAVEVSVLSVPEPLSFSSPEDLLKKLRPHVDGVVLKMGMSRATFLPQVWEQLPDPNDFLSHLSAKAGLSSRAWREPGTEVMIYHVEAFKESEMPHD
jgi:AmmeMemoRadiSam system protein A